MDDELDEATQVSFACAGIILCCIVEMFLIIMRFTIKESSYLGGKGLIITLIISGITVLYLALAYRIHRGSKGSWWFMLVTLIIYYPICIYGVYTDIIYLIELAAVTIILILLILPAVRKHCNIQFRKDVKGIVQ